MPGEYDTTMYIGDDWQRTVVITDPNGATVDLTGYSARWQVRRDRGSPTALLSIGTDTGEITISGATFTASAGAALTAAMTPGVYCHDLELVTPAGVVTTFLAGTMRVRQDVSR